MLEAAVTTSLVEDAAVPGIRISIRFSPFSQYWKRRMRPLIVLAFLVMLEGSAYAGWEVVAASETGMTVYIDRTTIHRHMYVVTMSVLHDYQVPERLSSGSFLSLTAQQQYDCGEARSRTVSAVVFTEHMGNGTVLDSGAGNDTWQPIAPMSINNALWQTACPEGKSTAVARLKQ